MRESGPTAGTPRASLAQIDEDRERRAEETRLRILTATLEACGERGYRRAAVRDTLERSGANRVQYYKLFQSGPDCYEEAYRDWIERLYERMIGAAPGAGGWSAGVRRGLGELAAFAVESPLLARGLIVEVHVAGGEALRRRAEVLARFERALDLAREEAGPRPAPPALTARFLAGRDGALAGPGRRRARAVRGGGPGADPRDRRRLPRRGGGGQGGRGERGVRLSPRRFRASRAGRGVRRPRAWSPPLRQRRAH